mgnify:CR=1 FL=1
MLEGHRRRVLPGRAVGSYRKLRGSLRGPVTCQDRAYVKDPGSSRLSAVEVKKEEVSNVEGHLQVRWMFGDGGRERLLRPTLQAMAARRVSRRAVQDLYGGRLPEAACSRLEVCRARQGKAAAPEAGGGGGDRVRQIDSGHPL